MSSTSEVQNTIHPVPPQAALAREPVQRPPSHPIAGDVAWKFFTQGLDAKVHSALEEIAERISSKATAFAQQHPGHSKIQGTHQPEEESASDCDDATMLSRVEGELRLALDELRSMRKQQSSLDLTSATSLRLMDVATIAWNRIHEILRDKAPSADAGIQGLASLPLHRCVLAVRQLISELYLTSIHYFSPFAASRDNQITCDPKRALYAATMCIRVIKDVSRVLHYEAVQPQAAAIEVGADGVEWAQWSYVILETVGQRVFGIPHLHLLHTTVTPPQSTGGSEVSPEQRDSLLQRFLASFRELMRARFYFACRLAFSPQHHNCAYQSAPDAHNCTLPFAGTAALQVESWFLRTAMANTTSSRAAEADDALQEIIHMACQVSRLYGDWSATCNLLLATSTSDISTSPQVLRGVMKGLLSCLAEEFLRLLRDQTLPQLHRDLSLVLRQSLDAVVQLGQLYAVDSEWDAAWQLLDTFGSLEAFKSLFVRPSSCRLDRCTILAFSSHASSPPSIALVNVANDNEEDTSSSHCRDDENTITEGALQQRINELRKLFLFRLLSLRASAWTVQPYEIVTAAASRLFEYPVASAIGCDAMSELLAMFHGANDVTGRACDQRPGTLITAVASFLQMWADCSPASDVGSTLMPAALRMIWEQTFVFRDCLISVMHLALPREINEDLRMMYLQQSELAQALLRKSDVKGAGAETFVPVTSRMYLMKLWSLGTATEGEAPTETDLQATLLLASKFLVFGDAAEGAQLWRCIGRSLMPRAPHKKSDEGESPSWMAQAEDAACKALSFHPTSVSTHLLLCDIRLAAGDYKGLHAATLQLLLCEPIDDAIDAFHALLHRLTNIVMATAPAASAEENSTSATCALANILDQFIRVVLMSGIDASLHRRDGGLGSGASSKVFAIVQAYITMLATPSTTTTTASLPLHQLQSLSHAATFLTSVEAKVLLDTHFTTSQQLWLASLLLEIVHNAELHREESHDVSEQHSNEDTACSALLDAAGSIVALCTKGCVSDSGLAPPRLLEAYELNLRIAFARVARAMTANERSGPGQSLRVPYTAVGRSSMYELAHRCEEAWDTLVQVRSLCTKGGDNCEVVASPGAAFGPSIDRTPFMIKLIHCHLSLWDCLCPPQGALHGSQFAQFEDNIAALVVMPACTSDDVESLAATPFLRTAAPYSTTEQESASTEVDPATIVINSVMHLTKRRLTWLTTVAVLAKKVRHFANDVADSATRFAAKQSIIHALTRCVSKGIHRQHQLAAVLFMLRSVGVVCVHLSSDSLIELQCFDCATPTCFQLDETLPLSQALADSTALLARFQVTLPADAALWNDAWLPPLDDDGALHHRIGEALVVDLWNHYCGALWAHEASKECTTRSPHLHTDVSMLVWQRLLRIFTDMLPQNSYIRASIDKQLPPQS